MRLGLVLVAVGLVAGGTARAAEMVAVKPGVMCRSADALAALTLPNGDSRTHAARPDSKDLALAASGGCIDIPLGARVDIVQGAHNTSKVHYAAPGAPADGAMIIPNVDFASGAEPAARSAPDVAVAERLPVGDGTTIELLLDRRMTPAIRDVLWGSGDADGSFMNHPELKPRFSRKVPANAELRLVSASGAVLARRGLELPLAKLAPAAIHGLPDPAFIVTVDYGIGMGGFNGPLSDLLSPRQSGLSTVTAVVAAGKTEPARFATTMHAGWKVVPARGGGPEEIESATCSGPSPETQRLHLWSYRYVRGQWTVAAREGAACGDLEMFPARREFP